MATQTDALLKAAADPTRLRILNLLRFGTICVCDLQAILCLPQPVVSRHLSVLRHAGLVVDRRQGNRILYALAPTVTPQMEALSQLVKTCSAHEEVLQADLARMAESLKQGPCSLSEKVEKEMRVS